MGLVEPGRYLVTAAQKNAPVNQPFRRSLEAYAQMHDAQILVLPMSAHRRPFEDEGVLAPELSDFRIITKPFHLNAKVQTSDYHILPQQIDPITGLARFTQSDVSTIFASPKQRLKVIPNSNVSLPKVLLTTGAITQPRYQENRIGSIARLDHVSGAVVVEIEDETRYHFRHIQATSRGSFVDLGVRYDGDRTSDAVLEALVLGDLHVGETDPLVRKASYELIDELNPRRLFLHDIFDGASVNHHEMHHRASRARGFLSGKLSLEAELDAVYADLGEYSHRMASGEVVVVKSNHDEFLDRYLEDGRFVHEPFNARLGAKLFVSLVDGEDPLVEGLSHVGSLPDNATFLSRDEDYKIRGWQLGSHGDRGGNGSRGSIRSKENSEGKSISGHTHTPEILRQTVSVGTSTKLRLDYTVGPGSWMNTHAALYENGKFQLINIIDGAWCS